MSNRYTSGDPEQYEFRWTLNGEYMGDEQSIQVTEADLRRGRIYPPLSCIREVSAKIAAEVATIAYDNGYTDKEKPADVLADIRENMYHPVYPHYV